MNSTVDEITKSITGRPSLFEYNVEELQRLTSQYPFFAPAKFLLAKKMKENNSFLFEEQIQKASIYFQNPIWFDHLLNNTGNGENFTELEKEEPVVLSQAELEIPSTHEEVVDQTQAEKIADQIETVEVVGQTEPGEAVARTATVEIVHQPESVEIADQIKTGEDAEEMENEEEEEQENQPAPELLIELPKFKFKPVDPSKAELTFEPYHTIDYFASQGIKAKEEDKPKEDQFTRQLKSFTEWIKIMKRLPQSEIAAAVSATDEKKVEKMAESSIHDREVVTEAMAEVWEKQGNTAKATEIYQKLSLLNPAKSSYFAAKIEHLKNL